MRKKFAFGYLWGEKSIWTMNTVLMLGGRGGDIAHYVEFQPNNGKSHITIFSQIKATMENSTKLFLIIT